LFEGNRKAFNFLGGIEGKRLERKKLFVRTYKKQEIIFGSDLPTGANFAKAFDPPRLVTGSILFLLSKSYNGIATQE